MKFGRLQITLILLLGVVLLLAFFASQQIESVRTGSIATGTPPPPTAPRRGLCGVVGWGDGRTALDLLQNTALLIHVWEPDASVVDGARIRLSSEKLSADRISVERGPSSRLPYAESLLDEIRVPPTTAIEALPAAELFRVLRPNGLAVVAVPSVGDDPPRPRLDRWLRDAGIANPEILEQDGSLIATFRKPRPKGTDDWSHWEHAPDNNPVSNDTLIRAPYMTQWLGQPYYITMPAITTASDGRIFIAMGHIAHHEREEPWLNTLMARNGYNGTVLWKKKLPDGYLAHRSAFIATPETFLMISLDGEGLSLLDPETGTETATIRVPSAPGQWKWIALQSDVLFALVGPEPDPSETTIVRSQMGHWSWGELSPGYYTPRVPWGHGRTLLAYNLKQRRLIWKHETRDSIDSRALALGGDRLYFYCPDSQLGCLDAASGKVCWTNTDPRVPELIEQKPTRRLESTPGFRSTCYALYTPKALYYQAQTHNNIVAVSTEDGRYLWHRDKTTSNPNTLYLDGRILVGIGEHGNTLALDPLTGETLEDLGFRKRSCARLTATPDSLFCRGWNEGLTRYDRDNKKALFNAAFRPSCNDGVIGANGLLYLGPWTCDCNLSLMGRVALCPAGDFRFDHEATDETNLEAGKDGSAEVVPLQVSANDWPTYRANNKRSAATVTKVSLATGKATPLWHRPPERTAVPTAPTAAGGLIFLADDRGTVKALDAATGTPKWTCTTGGPILQPPTIWNGRAYVGSGDGHIYALEAATGRLLWRLRAAPTERRIMVYGTLCSTWPVNTGVLIENGVAYAAAGIIDYDGTYLYALDAITGKIRWQNNSSGHLNPGTRKGISAQGCLTSLAGRLWMPGGNIISPAAYDIQTGKYLSGDPGDGSVNMAANRGEDIGVFRDSYLLMGGRLRYSAYEDVVNPGRYYAIRVREDGGLGPERLLQLGKVTPAWNNEIIFLIGQRGEVPACCTSASLEDYYRAAQTEQKRWPQPDWIGHALAWRADWMRDCQAVSLALAGNTAVVVGKQKMPRKLEDRWQVWCLNPANGNRIWQRDLPSPALMGGLLIDRDGRIVVTLQNGGVVCFAE